MLNYIWLGLVLAAVILGGVQGRLDAVTEAAFESAKTAVMTIALPLIGITALWLGVMRLAERAGMIQSLAVLLRPVLRRLFPDVPADHPAMGSILMNLSANMIGLTNAATPLGLRAMADLERLNRTPGTATNAMCTFLAINTSSVQLLPTTAIGILAAAGSTRPTAIVATALLATLCSTAVGITAVKLLERLRCFRLPTPATNARLEVPEAGPDRREPAAVVAPMPRWGWAVLVGFLVFFAGLLGHLLQQPPPGPEAVPGVISTKLYLWPELQQTSAGPLAGSAFIRVMNAVSLLAIPFFLAGFPLYAALRRVPVYEEFVEGAKEGFHVAVRIIPFLVAMLLAVGMFRAAGGIELLAWGLRPALDWVGLPTELLPMTLMRPLSGSATIGLFTELVKTHGADSLISRMAATILGSTETTLYVVAVYFGAVSIRRTRHAVAAGLLADLAGVIASVAICWVVFGRGG